MVLKSKGKKTGKPQNNFMVYQGKLNKNLGKLRWLRLEKFGTWHEQETLGFQDMPSLTSDHLRK